MRCLSMEFYPVPHTDTIAQKLIIVLVIGMAWMITGCSWQNMLRPDSAEQALTYGRWQRGQEEQLARFFGMPKNQLQAELGKPTEIVRNAWYYVQEGGRYVSKQADEQWIYGKRNIWGAYTGSAYSFYFKDNTVVQVSTF